MKHCPDPDCPHRRLTGNPAQYRDEIAVCADCGTALEPGSEAPLPDPAEESLEDGDELVTVARFSNSHEAHMARASLESEHIPSVVNQDHGPFVTAAAWVTVAVPKPYLDLAQQVLDRGPLHGTTGIVEDEDEDEDDSIERAARQRKIGRAGRWVAFLAIVFAVAGTFSGFVTLSLVNKVRLVLEPFADHVVVPDYVLYTILEERAIDLQSESPRTAGELRSDLDGIAIWGFVYYYILAAVYTGLYFWARKSPVAALIIALCAYLMLLIIDFVADPAGLLQGWLWKVLTIGVLVTGIQEALRESGERERLAPATVQGD